MQGLKLFAKFTLKLWIALSPLKTQYFGEKIIHPEKQKTNKKPLSSSILKLCKSLKKQVLLSLLQSSLGPLSDTLLPSQLGFFRSKGQRHPSPVLCTFWEGQRWNTAPQPHLAPVILTALWFGFKVTTSIWKAYWKFMACLSSYKP